jgi:hypothetical protein
MFWRNNIPENGVNRHRNTLEGKLGVWFGIHNDVQRTWIIKSVTLSLPSQVMFLVLLIHFHDRHCINTDYQWASHHDLIIISVYMTANAAFHSYSNNRNLWCHDNSVKLFSEQIWSYKVQCTYILSKTFIFAKYMVLVVSNVLYLFSYLLHCRSLLQPQISDFNRLETYNICILLQRCLESWAYEIYF